jgi:hypothetical protein
MPFNELQRRDSWPPTILRISDDDADEINPIDEDPFSYFLTSPDDLDDDEDLSAGIESATKPTQVREVSPSSLQRSSLPFEDDDIDEEFFLASPFSLRDPSSDGRESRAAQRHDSLTGLTGLGISLPQLLRSNRGRPTVRLTPPSRGGRGRGQTRSLSARRPHAWRVPSPDLGSIIEEKECEEDGQIESEINKKEDLSMSAPMPSEIEKAKKPKKPKKRVHWAF